MKIKSLKSGAFATRAEGLSSLAGITLSPDRQQQLELAMVASGGSAGWRGRKRAEAWDLLALSQLAPAGRLQVEFLDLRTALRAAVALRVPVPCMPQPGGELFVAGFALLGITYRQEALSRPQPGPSIIQILAPSRVWHANVAFDPIQPLCLGAQLSAGIRIKEIILMAYGALSHDRSRRSRRRAQSRRRKMVATASVPAAAVSRSLSRRRGLQANECCQL
jgi:hypothetical protein